MHCGIVFCDHGPKASLLLNSGYTITKITRGKTVSYCNAATSDFGADSPSYVPNGAKCGQDKMCLNRKCVSVTSVRINCADCNGNGVCNSFGHCHCFDGWAPPYCDKPGFGGSIDCGFLNEFTGLRYSFN